jgi:hypothetical protein
MRSGSNFGNSYKGTVIVKLWEAGGQQVPIHKYQSQQKIIWFIFHIIKDYITFTQMKINK